MLGPKFFQANKSFRVKPSSFSVNSGQPVCCFWSELTSLYSGMVSSVTILTIYKIFAGGVPLTMKVKTEVVDDGAKTLTLSAMEGDVLLLYKSFKGTITVSEGLVTWTIEFEKATILTPPPQLYIPLIITLSALVDAYLLFTN